MGEQSRPIESYGNTPLVLSIDLRCHMRPRTYVAQPIGKMSNAWFENVYELSSIYPLTH